MSINPPGGGEGEEGRTESKKLGNILETEFPSTDLIETLLFVTRSHKTHLGTHLRRSSSSLDSNANFNVFMNKCRTVEVYGTYGILKARPCDYVNYLRNY